MTKKYIYILIGLPGSGKSTYAMTHKKENDIVLSSDILRKELLGDENNQSNNGSIFNELFNRFETAIKEKKGDIFIDATSISAKDRRKLFMTIKRFNKGKITRVGNGVEIEKIYNIKGIVFKVNLDQVIDRDFNRERVVGRRTILRMFTRYMEPSLDEGFDEIIEIKSENNLSTQFKNELDTFLNGGKNLEKLLDSNNLMRDSIDCEQTSVFHQENLLTHLTMILELIDTDYSKKMFSENDYKLFRLITIFHDIGKPFLRNTKMENMIWRGYKYLGENKFQKKSNEIVEVENYNDFQFLGHEDLSTNIYNLEFKDYLISENIIIKQEADLIEIVIKGHLLFHKNQEKRIKISDKIYTEDTEVFRIGTMFSDYDGKGRIKI
ncbi:MAG: AAA family ATPase [Candidatus Gracilibacteria bacterium]|nr:AAA family ATPase [Candidatus Gracilibacteria bacterium]